MEEKLILETHGWLDSNDRNPDLFGDAILLRDDDGIGFALNLEKHRGKHVKITIEEVPTDDPCYWAER